MATFIYSCRATTTLTDEVAGFTSSVSILASCMVSQFMSTGDNPNGSILCAESVKKSQHIITDATDARRECIHTIWVHFSLGFKILLAKPERDE